MKSITSILSLLLCLWGGSLLGQMPFVIHGTVTDSLGAPVNNISITYFVVDTFGVFQGVSYTNANGYYESVLGATSPADVTLTYSNCNGGVTTVNFTNVIDTLLYDFVYCGTGGGNPCDAQFGHTVSGNSVSFVDQSVNAVTWNWDFGDGNSSTLANPIHTYASAGVYTVCLTITDLNGGCTDIICDQVFINNINPCDASFNYQSSGSTYSFFPVNANPMGGSTVTWSFGDGNTSNQFYPTHTYAQADTYLVCLYVTNNFLGCSDSSCQWIVVWPNQANCVAGFTSTVTGDTASFTNQSTGPGGLNYYWDFGDGSFSTQSDPTHIYSQPGTYTVCLFISDSLNQCWDQICDTVVVNGGFFPCDADFDPFITGNLVNFFDLSSGNNLTYSWDFGDGNTSNQSNPINIYSSPGVYVVCLTVTDPTGCTDTHCETVVIGNNNPCDPTFTYTNQQGSNIVDFSVVNPNPNTTYTWDFGDGTTGTGANVTHTYMAAGSYTVCLTAMGGGCVDTSCQVVNVSVINPPPGFAVLGQVWAGGNAADDFTAWLIVYDSVAGTLTAVDTFVSDSSFGYFFFVAPNGDYMVKASLNPGSAYYANYMPTYYGDELFWYDATVVNQGSFPLLTINLVPGMNPGGPGFIGGLVSQGANKTEGDPLEGMHILLTDVFNNPISYTFTDSDGAYSFPDLAYGTYRVWVEVWGLELNYNEITLSPDNPSYEIADFEVNDTKVTVSETTGIPGLLQGTDLNIFPIPANDLLHLEMNLARSAELDFSMVNMLGQEVLSHKQNLHTGQVMLDLNVKSLNNGVYILNISEGNSSLSPIKVVISR